MIEAIVQDLASAKGYVNPPQLQIVGEALYRHLRDSTQEDRLTLQSYQSLGRARTIIREHLVNAVEYLGPRSRIGWQVLSRLVGPDNLRVSRREDDLRGNLSSQDFDRVMSYFVNSSLVVRELSSADQAFVYTLTHDYLIEEINEHFKDSLELQAWRSAIHRLTPFLRTGSMHRKLPNRGNCCWKKTDICRIMRCLVTGRDTN